MGDDLSSIMRCLSETNKLVIVLDKIYKLMPYMLDDFISLYKESMRVCELEEHVYSYINKRSFREAF